MARLKSEALQVKWDQQGISRKAKFVGAMPQRLASLAAVAIAVRGLNRLAPVKWVLEKLYDIDRRRSLPAPSSHSFNRWWKRNRERGPQGGKPIALFVDAWNRFLEPEIAIAVVELLWSCGYDVTVLEPFDALRTRLSMGLLDQAAELGQKLFEQLEPFALAGTPIVCIEPSEASALKDDLPDLIRDEQLGRRISGSVQLLDDFLASQLAPGDFQLTKINPQETRSIVVHPHCHQRALFRPEATREILTAAGFTTQITDLGCCGMAGSFGYSNYDVSRQIAQQRFLPAIQATQNAGKIFVATGTSCREQSLDLAQTQITHWAAWIKGTMRLNRADE
jgi:Fe-S oxidoreductase